MKSLFFWPLLLTFVFPVQNPASPDGSAITVLGAKCYKTRQKLKASEPTSVTPSPEMIPADKNFQRNARINAPMGTRDPHEGTIDARSAVLDKNVQDSRDPNAKPVDGFTYEVQLQNTSKKTIEILFWEYQFVDQSTPTNVVRRQFLCGINIKPDKDKEIRVFSVAGPSTVVNATGGISPNNIQEKVIINRLEYSDGSIWQRKDWNSGEIKAGYTRAMAAPWQPGEMCRGL